MLDAQEPDNAITLNSLQMRVFNAAGTTLEFTANLAGAPLNLTSCPVGAGSCVSVFGLDAIEANILQNTQGFDGSWIVAFSAGLSNATGNQDEFFLGNANSPPVTAVPEPGTLAVFGAGAVGLGLLGWRRKRKQVAAA